MNKFKYSTAILDGYNYLLKNYPEVFVIGQGLWSPWYVGNTMKDLLDAHFSDIKSHLDNLKNYLSTVFDTHIHPTGVGPSGPPTVPAASFSGQIDSTKSAIDGSIDDLVTTLSKYGKTK